MFFNIEYCKPSFLKWLSLLNLISIITLYSAAGQNISGVINTYTGVTGANSTNVTVANSTGFASGNTVLIIQMQGATIDQTNSSSFGNILSYNGSGKYEFGVISAVNGNNITLQNALCNAYNTNGVVQLMTVPVYSNVTVVDTLTCSPWNGTNGGVLALEVTGTLTLNSAISVDGKGFRGGIVAHGGFGCNVTNWYSVAGSAGGGKGESISKFIAGGNGGRGKWASGGGGGQPGNSGGGGGGNASAGGLGGFEYSGCGATGIQGIGGVAPAYTSSTAFMGGGGGGGFSDNSQLVTPGTNGGGIILIKANTIIGNNNTIKSNGLNQNGISADESAGGGGAGGCISLEVSNFTGNLTIETNGGNGGNTYNQLFPRDCHGPGGGGGAGMLLISQPSIPSNVTFSANGGKAGLVQNPNSTCYNTSFGGTVGAGTPATSSIYNFVFPEPITDVKLGNDTSICPNATVLLNAHSGYASYLWQDNSTDSTFTVTDSGTYFITVSNAAGCTAKDTIIVSLNPPLPKINIGNDTAICPKASFQLNAGAGYAAYLWQDNSTNPTFTVTNTGTYFVRVNNPAGCSTADTILVSLKPPLPKINIGNDTAICPKSSFQLSAPAGYGSYVWQDNSTNPTFTVKDSGTYFVTVSNAAGCSTADTLLVTFKPAFPISLGNDTTTCVQQPVLLTPGPGFASYVWQDGSTGSTFLTTLAGSYTVTVTNGPGCAGIDDITITQNPLPTVNLGNDTTFCTGQSITLDAGSDYISYQWQDSSTNETLTVFKAGTYIVTVQNSQGCVGSGALTVFPLDTIGKRDLIGNETVCPGTAIVIAAPPGYTNYLWDNTQPTRNLTVKDTGVHTLMVTTPGGCSIYDTTIVTPYCEPTLYFPNAFSPNKDGTNDQFKPFGVKINTYSLQIFNRWGEKIFETTNINHGWDGTFNNKDCSTGTYTYFATFTSNESGINKSGLVKGNVTLLR